MKEIIVVFLCLLTISFFASCAPQVMERTAVQKTQQQQIDQAKDVPFEPVVAPPPPKPVTRHNQTPQIEDDASLNPLQDELDDKLAKLYDQK
jgi:hypothetical protein